MLLRPSPDEPTIQSLSLTVDEKDVQAMQERGGSLVLVTPKYSFLLAAQWKTREASGSHPVATR
jgi:hypothetical protein